MSFWRDLVEEFGRASAVAVTGIAPELYWDSIHEQTLKPDPNDTKRAELVAALSEAKQALK